MFLYGHPAQVTCSLQTTAYPILTTAIECVGAGHVIRTNTVVLRNLYVA